MSRKSIFASTQKKRTFDDVQFSTIDFGEEVAVELKQKRVQKKRGVGILANKQTQEDIDAEKLAQFNANVRQKNLENRKAFEELQFQENEPHINTYDVVDGNISVKIIERVNVPWQDLPTPKMRNVETTPVVDFNTEDTEFQLLDIQIGCTTDYNKDGHDQRKTTVYLSGTTENGLTVVVFVNDYYPYFYLSIPYSYYVREEAFLEELESQFRTFRRNRTYVPTPHHMSIVDKFPTTGYRDTPLKYVKFEMNTVQDIYSLKRILLTMFPVTTKEDILSGQWEKRNETVICEDGEEEIKFINTHQLVTGGWCKLSAGTYEPIDDNLHMGFYGYNVSCKHIRSIQRDTFSNFLIDSADAEQENHVEDVDRFPEADDPLDHMLSMAHSIQDFKKKFPRFNCVFIWGEQKIQVLPEHIRELRLKENTTIHIFRYHGPKDMMRSWSKWWSQTQVSTDVVIGHNIFGYDLKALASRLISEKVYRNELEPEEKMWGRLRFFPLEMRTTKIESKAIAYSEYTTTPSFGRIFIDTLIMYQRDVTVKLTSYKLDSLLKHFLGVQKVDLHHSLIKSSFYGTPEDRGKLAIYNMGDVFGVFALTEKSSHILKFFQMTQVNLVPPNMICTRGQSIKVYGGFHNNALQNGYVVHRPYYHPLLDNPVFDDLSKMINQSDDFQNASHGAMRFSTETQAFQLFGLNEEIDHETIKFSSNDETNVVKDDDSSSVKTKSPSSKQEQIQLQRERESADVLKIKMDKTNLVNSLYNKTLGIETQSEIDAIADGKVPNITMYGYRKHTVVSKKAKSDVEKQAAKKHATFNGISINEILENAKNKKTKASKGFSGGFVMEPRIGLSSNIAILDWNSLYPNIMHNYWQDPSVLVLEKQFANLPDVTYNDVRFNEHMVFRYATSKAGVRLNGVLIRHTWNLVCTRKIVQGFQSAFEILRDDMVNMYRDALNKLGDWGYNPDGDLDTQLNAQTDKIANRRDFVADEQGDLRNHRDFYQTWFAKQYVYTMKLLDKNKAAMMKDKSLDEHCVAIKDELAAFISRKASMDEELFKKNCEIATVLLEMLRDTAVKHEAVAERCNNAETDASYLGKSLFATIAATLNDLRVQFKNYDSKQNELKTGSNSTFGFAGAGGIPLFHAESGAITHRSKHQTIPISACITFIGRFCIATCRDYLEKKYGFEVIYIDTDSLFIDMHLPDTEEAFKSTFPLAAKICRELSDMHPGTMTIKHEKTARKMLAIGPKIYALFKFERPDEPDGKIDIKGMQIKKRDYCAFIRETGLALIQIILRKGDIKAGMMYLRGQMKDLIDGKISIEKLKLYKKITKSNYGPESIIGHVMLAKRIELRTPGQGPKSGEYVEYAYIDVGYDPKNVKKMHEKIEDFSFIVKNNLPIDYIFYVTKHFRQPLNSILENLVLKNDLEDFWRDVVHMAELKQFGDPQAEFTIMSF